MANVNTSSVNNPSMGFYTIGGSATVTVSGVGSGTFNDSIIVFSNFSVTSPIVGFEDTTIPLDILTDTSNTFNNYKLDGSIGPISGVAGIPTYD